MPFIPATDPGLRSDISQPPAVPPTGNTMAAAFRESNSVVSLMNSIYNSGQFEPDQAHNPMDLIKDTPYEAGHLNSFVGSRSEGETRSIMRKIDQEEADKRLLEAGGTGGLLMQMVAGSLDPTMLMPGGMAVKAGKEGYVLGRAARATAGAFALQSASQEALLQASQETRTAGESLLNVGSATILGAMIGPLAAKLLTPAEHAAAVAVLDRERVAMDAHAAGPQAAPVERPPTTAPPLIPEALPPAPSAAPGLTAALGAAGTDTRQLKPVGYGLDRVPGVAGVVERTDPMLRLFGSESVSARRTAADLAETPLLMQENLQGIPTTAGPALDRMARMDIAQTRVAVADELDSLFADYRFGNADTTFPRARAAFQRATGSDGGKMTFAEFKSEVSKALQEGDKHEIPQVAQAAQFVRNRVFEPWKQRAIEAGLFPEDLAAPKGAESYLQRVYNKQAIAAKRPDFVNRVTDYLKGDQATKAAAQERIGAYHGALTVAQDQIEKIRTRIEALSSDAEVIQARQEETTRINKLANRRSEQLRESQYKNEGGIRVDVPGKGIENARGGAIFETNVRQRGNVLADRVSGKLAEIESLEQKLGVEVNNHDAMRAKIEKEIAAWEGQSVREAKAAIKAREKYAADKAREPDAARLTSADGAIDTAVQRIIKSDRTLSEQELRSQAHEITDRIIGSPDGRLPYDLGSDTPGGFAGGERPRGALAARNFAIPDAAIRDFLESDVEQIVNTHLRTMVPDVMLTERFGDVRMTEAFRKINDEYAALADAATSEKARTRLEKERQGVIRDLAAIRDRARHIYGMAPEGPMRQAGRAIQSVKNFNVLTSMGMATISSLPDMAGAVFRHGIGAAFNDAWSPFIRSMMGGAPAYKEAKSQFRAMGIAVETTLAQRSHALSDTMDAYRPQSRTERTLQWGSDKFQLLNFLAPWTDTMKTWASLTAGSEILRAAKASVEGKATKRTMRSLGESGMDPAMAERVYKSFQESGVVQDGVLLPNTADWKDLAARRAFEGAVSREADIAVVTPGSEKPLWLSHPILSVFGQFKSFTAAATQRILIANLQRHDAQVLQGLMVSMAMGMLSYKLNSVTGGQPTSDRPQDWIKEAMSRGSILGWLEEGNSIASKMTRGGVDVYRLIGANKPVSRYAALSAKDQLLGPTAGKIDAMIKATSAAAARDWTHSDTTALRRLIVGQNLWWLRGAFNQVETGANNAFGIPLKEPTKH